jgi:hypothetical protein
MQRDALPKSVDICRRLFPSDTTDDYYRRLIGQIKNYGHRRDPVLS